MRDRKLHRPAALLGTALALGVLVSGCGTSTVNTQKAESVLKKNVAAQTGVRIASVTCPENIPAKKGGNFTCIAHGSDGTHAPIHVTQTDNNGNITYNADLVRQNVVQAQIKEYVQPKALPATGTTVKCPEVVEFAAGHTYTCAVTAGEGENAKAVVTMKNSGDGFSFVITQ